MRKVKCTRAWPYAHGEPLVLDAEYEVSREFWRNGEPWMVLYKGDKRTEAPSVFFYEFMRETTDD